MRADGPRERADGGRLEPPQPPPLPSRGRAGAVRPGAVPGAPLARIGWLKERGSDLIKLGRPGEGLAVLYQGECLAHRLGIGSPRLAFRGVILEGREQLGATWEVLGPENEQLSLDFEAEGWLEEATRLAGLAAYCAAGADRERARRLAERDPPPRRGDRQRAAREPGAVDPVLGGAGRRRSDGPPGRPARGPGGRGGPRGPPGGGHDGPPAAGVRRSPRHAPPRCGRCGTPSRRGCHAPTTCSRPWPPRWTPTDRSAPAGADGPLGLRPGAGLGLADRLPPSVAARRALGCDVFLMALRTVTRER